MGDDISLGSVCFDFHSTNVLQISNWKYAIYGPLTTIDDILSCTELYYDKNQNKRNPNRCHHPLISNYIFAIIR